MKPIESAKEKLGKVGNKDKDEGPSDKELGVRGGLEKKYLYI